MKKIAVTGGSGRLGTWVVRALLERGYEVTVMDEKTPDKPLCRTIVLNLNNLGAIYGSLQGMDGVIHLGAIPAPGGMPNETVFVNNVVSTYNVLEASSGLGIERVALASSESAYGFAWAPKPFAPLYAPVDETHPLLVQECYGLSKEVNERTAEMFHRRTGMQAVSLRFSTVVTPDDAGRFFADASTPSRKMNTLWSYIDVRDAATASVLALETDNLGAVSLNITDDFTCMNIRTQQLIESCFPDTEIRQAFEGYEAVVSNAKAKRLLKWQPQFSWRAGNRI